MKRTLVVLSLVGVAGLALLTAGPSWAVEVSGLSRTGVDLSWADAEAPGDERGALFSQYLRAEASRLPYGTTVFASGSLKWDLGNEEEGAVFYTEADESSSNTRFLLYEAGVEVSPERGVALRAGRIDWGSVERVHIDGAGLRFAPRALGGVEVSGFGGRVVQFHEDLDHEAVFGAGLKVPLPSNVTLTADYMDYDAALVEVGLSGGCGDFLWGNTEVEWVDGDLREARARALVSVAATGTRVTLGLKRRNAQDDFTDYRLDYTAIDSDYRYEIERLNLEREANYNQYELGVEQDLAGVATLSAAYVKRDLLDEPVNESRYNTSFDVYTLGLSLREPGIKGLYIDGRYSLWDEDRLQGHEASSASWSLAVEQEFLDAASAYVSWYEKEEDINNTFESQVARALSVGASYRGGGLWKVSLDYTRETDDVLETLYGVDSIHTVATRLTVNF